MQLKKRIQVLLIWGILLLLFIIPFSIIISCKKNIDIQKPVAFFDVFPKNGNTVTEFQFDASETIIEGDDRELFYRWDWESDGNWDTPHSRFIRKEYFQYSSPGEYTAILEIMDSGGLTDTAQFSISVSNGTNETGIIIHILGTELDPVLQYYGTVKIGDQWWMSENLNTDNIAFFSGPDNFRCYKECYNFPDYLSEAYDKVDNNSQKYGGMYRINDLMVLKFANYYYDFSGCRKDMHGNIIPCPKINVRVCPNGWHISTTDDWNQLIDYLGPDAAKELKPGGSSDFYVLYGGEGLNTQSSGIIYNGLEEFASFATLDFEGIFTSATSMTNVFQIFNNNSEVYINSYSTLSRYSVRCVKDN